MSNKRPTQCERVLRYIEDFGEIDSMTAMKELGVMRLASRISELKSMGVPIKRQMEKGKNRYGESVSWAVYSVGGESNA